MNYNYVTRRFVLSLFDCRSLQDAYTNGSICFVGFGTEATKNAPVSIVKQVNVNWCFLWSHHKRVMHCCIELISVAPRHMTQLEVWLRGEALPVTTFIFSCTCTRMYDREDEE